MRIVFQQLHCWSFWRILSSSFSNYASTVMCSIRLWTFALMAGLEIIFFLLGPQSFMLKTLLRKWICVIPHTPLGSDSLLLYDSVTLWLPSSLPWYSLTNLFPPMLQPNPYSRLPKFFQPCLMVESMHCNYFFIFYGIEYLNIRAYTSLAIDNNCYFESWGMVLLLWPWRLKHSARNF